MAEHRRRRRVALVVGIILTVLTLTMGALTAAMLWPYDDVRYGSEPAEVSPKVVTQGGIVTLTRTWYCNDDQDITVTRWADRYDESGRITASFELGRVQFFNRGQGLACYTPSKSAVTLPNYVIGANGEASMFRLRLITEYQPNPVNTVTLVRTSEPFLVVPAKEPTTR